MPSGFVRSRANSFVPLSDLILKVTHMGVIMSTTTNAKTVEAGFPRCVHHNALVGEVRQLARTPARHFPALGLLARMSSEYSVTRMESYIASVC